MNLQINKPAVEQRVLAQLQSGHFHDADELLAKALDALERTSGDKEELAAIRGKSFVELCDAVRGLAEDIDFSRNPSTGRPLVL